MKRSQYFRADMRAKEADRTRTPRDPFDVKLSDEQRKTLALWLCDELQRSLDAKAAQDGEVDYWYQLYEQARTRSNAPWNDAADLTSYIGADKVDALQARIMRTVFQEPIWTVEGWGDAANRAAYVEEFHQWKAEEEDLESTIDRFVLQALIEPRGLLEIAEGSELRTQRKRINAAVQTDPITGGPIFDEKGAAVLQQGDDGNPVESTDSNQLSAETIVDSKERIRTGPVYRLLPYRDSAIFPGHARDKEEIYGYAKRFWRRYDEIIAKTTGTNPIYDPAAVEKMTTTSDKESDPALERSNMNVAPTDKGQSQKELWEILILVDLESLLSALGQGGVPKELKGERWYLTTIHPNTYSLLRVQFDDLERSRFVPVILFPRTDRATEGYSFVGHKLVTIIEEHTAVRNMRADRGGMQAKAPMKRLQGALWDPFEQPFGPNAVIDVRAMNEVEPMVIPDVTSQLVVWAQECERTAERVAGINDIASGQVSQETRTLGEVQMATEQSFVRMDLIVRRFQKALEDIAQIRHAIWKRVLAEQASGMEAPTSLLQNLEGRGVSIDEYMPDKKVTASLLEGAFRFKPYGSVQNADPNHLKQNWIQFMQALPMMLQAFPMAVPWFQTPQAARAIVREALHVFNVRNQQAFLGTPAQDMETQAKIQIMNLIQQLGAGSPAGPMGPPAGVGAPAPGMPPAPNPLMAAPSAPMAPSPVGPQ